MRGIEGASSWRCTFTVLLPTGCRQIAWRVLCAGCHSLSPLEALHVVLEQLPPQGI